MKRIVIKVPNNLIVFVGENTLTYSIVDVTKVIELNRLGLN